MTAILIISFERESMLSALADSLGGTARVFRDGITNRNYADRNWIRAIDETFRDPNIASVITLDDDVVVSHALPHVLESALLWSIEWLNAPHLISSVNACAMDIHEKRRKLKSVRFGIQATDNVLIPRLIWNRIGPMLLDYDDEFCGVLNPNHDAIRQWLRQRINGSEDRYVRHHFQGSDCGTGRDAVTLAACAIHGISGLMLNVNRLINVGPVRTSGMVPHNVLTGTTLDVFEEDSHITDFILE